MKKKKIQESERKGWRRQKPHGGAQPGESPRSGGRRRGGQTRAARGQLSGSGQARQPAVRAGPTGIPGADPAAWGATAAALPHMSGLRAEAEPGAAAPRKAEGENAGSRERGGSGRYTPRTATEWRCPPNNPKEFSRKLPISLRHLCVCERRARERERESEGERERRGSAKS